MYGDKNFGKVKCPFVLFNLLSYAAAKGYGNSMIPSDMPAYGFSKVIFAPIMV